MIPIVSLANLLNAVIAFMICLRVYRIESELPKDTSHSLVHYFARFFLSFGLMWFFYALPGLFVFEITHITVAQFLGDVFAFIAVLVGLRITFHVLNQPVGTFLSSALVAVLAVIYIVGRFQEISLSNVETFGPYIYFIPNLDFRLEALVGVAASFGSIVFAGTFWSIYRLQKKNGQVAKSALFLSFGMILMFGASAVFFILITPGVGAAMLSAVLSLLGLVLLQRGIPYRGELKIT